jgi:hypothetical protein
MSIKIKKFTSGLRVTVKDGPLKGLSGTVRRCRRADYGAWIEMDDLPEGKVDGALFPFANQKGDSRQDHTLLYPKECTLGKVDG